MTYSLDRYEELSHFLRMRRERITPEQIGLPETRRRRTPGLLPQRSGDVGRCGLGLVYLFGTRASYQCVG